MNVTIMNVHMKFFGTIKLNIGFLLAEMSVIMESRLAKSIPYIEIASYFMYFLSFSKILLFIIFLNQLMLGLSKKEASFKEQL